MVVSIVSLTCHHEREVKAFFHGLPVNLVRQRGETNVLLFLETNKQTNIKRIVVSELTAVLVGQPMVPFMPY